MKTMLPVTLETESGTSLAEQLKEQIIWLIALGELKPGMRLPTVVELADHLRVNRNTVAEVYTQLRQQGFLVARQGQGTSVADSEVVRQAVRKAALGRVVDRALARARAMGFTPEEFTQAAGARARTQTALQQRRRALFVECNEPEIEFHTRTLTEELGLSIDGVHLDQVRRDPQAFRRRARATDLVITTLFHLEEVQKATGESAEVIGLGAGLEVQFLRALAQLPRGSRVAICCIDNARASRIRRLLVNTGVQHLDMTACGVDEEPKLRKALTEADVVYVSLAAQPQAKRILGETAKLRTYQLALDRAGVEMLKARLAEVGR